MDKQSTEHMSLTTRYATNHTQQTKSRHSRLHANIHVSMQPRTRPSLYRQTRKWFNAIVRYLLLWSSYLHWACCSSISPADGCCCAAMSRTVEVSIVDFTSNLSLSVSSRRGICRIRQHQSRDMSFEWVVKWPRKLDSANLLSD